MPHNCAILAVDPGDTSGWSTWIDGKLYDSGTCDSPYEGSPFCLVSQAIHAAGGLPKNGGKTLVMVIERPFRVRFANQTSIGAVDKIWRVAAEQCGLKIVRVYPSTWRSRVLGGRWANAKRDAVRVQEQAFVEHQYGIKNVHPDEAPAILIGKWGTTAGEVGAKLPKRARAA